MDQSPEITCIPFAFPGIENVRCAFTTRQGGHSRAPFNGANISFDTGDDPEHVRANRRQLQAQLKFSSWIELKQVHGDIVHIDPVPGKVEEPGYMEGDGAATSAPGRAIAVKTADCQPILLAHKSGGYVMGLHAGWRGNRIDFPGQGVARFCAAYGLDPADILAVRGPSLGPGRSEFVNFEEEFGPDFARWYRPETHTVDLWALTRSQLQSAGLRPEHIFSLDLCTMSLEHLFFSYRGARPTGRDTGRQVGLIWIEA